MTTDTAPVDILASFALPSDWQPAAVDAFREVLTVRPGLDGPELVSLETACALLSLAATLEDVARTDGWTSTGAAGQTTAHVFLSEIRLARNQAAAIMHRLVAPVTGPSLTNSQRGALAAKARWQNHAGRATGRARGDV